MTWLGVALLSRFAAYPQRYVHGCPGTIFQESKFD
jgi:hypothetical protein